MNNEQRLKLKACKNYFAHSIHPLLKKEQAEVEIVGLDSEYWEDDQGVQHLYSWQLWGQLGGVFKTQTPLTLVNLERALIGCAPPAKHYLLAVFSVDAEAQFFQLDEWVVSEFKGKYSFQAERKGIRYTIFDLFTWYRTSLAKVAESWGLQKRDYPVVEAMKAFSHGDDSMVATPEFVDYALNDAYLTYEILRRIRAWILEDYGLDIAIQKTAASTAMAIFRTRLDHSIEWKSKQLRDRALRCSWGGRMEMFFRGTADNTFEYDAESHHPTSAIHLGVLPEPQHWKHSNDMKEILTAKGGLCWINFDFPKDTRYPCLPEWADGYLIYPLEGESFCTVAEVKLAAQYGAKLVSSGSYIYTDGSRDLPDFLTELFELRHQETNEARRKLLKLFTNSVIGKLLQKNEALDQKQIEAYSLEHAIPVEIVRRMTDLPFKKRIVSVGASFYPEWYALILGQARANISEYVSLYDALNVSSDSFVTKSDLDDGFDDGLYHYSLKAKGSYLGYRSRLYKVGEKTAHHAIHGDTAAQQELFHEFTKLPRWAYTLTRPLKLYEAQALDKAYGQRIIRQMTADTTYDNKRILQADGWTRPWPSIMERRQTLGL